jgi:hypothetical protein
VREGRRSERKGKGRKMRMDVRRKRSRGQTRGERENETHWWERGEGRGYEADRTEQNSVSLTRTTWPSSPEVDLFKGWTKTSLYRVCGIMHDRLHEAGEVVIKQGEAPQDV